jgi:hypothetical protein
MKTEMTARFRGSMRGRTMYVVPFCMGALDGPSPQLANPRDSTLGCTSDTYSVAIAGAGPRLRDHHVVDREPLVREGH